MSEYVPESSSDNPYGRFSHIVIASPSEKKFAQRLKKTELGGTVKLIDTDLAEVELPTAIQHITFEASHPAPSETIPNFSGSISISLQSIADFTQKEHAMWGDTYLSNLKASLEANDYIINHVIYDLSTLHVRLDNEYAVSIKLTSTLERCSVELNLETIDELETALGEMSDTVSGDSSESMTIARHFMTALNISVDTVLATFEEPASTLFTLNFLPAVSAEDKERLAKQALAFAESEIEMPAHDIIAHPKGLSDLAGVFEPKARLTEIAEIFNDKQALQLYNLAPSHFLLYGPTGTGKSTLVEAFAKSIGAKYTVIPTAPIPKKFTNDSSTGLEEIFEQAYKHAAPQVLFFGEFDALGSPKATGTVHHIEARRRLQELIDDVTAQHPEIIIAAETSAKLEDIEPALRRYGRLEPICVNLPTFEERLDIFGALLVDQSSLDIELASLDYETVTSDDPPTQYDIDINCVDLANQTDGFSITDIVAILEAARTMARHRSKESTTIEPVVHADIVAAINKFKSR